MLDKTKICSTPGCGEKLLTEFYFNKNKNKGKGVYNSICKTCSKNKIQQYVKANPEKYKAIKKKYNESHKEQILEYSRKYDSKEVQKRFYEKNKEKIFLYKKERRKYDFEFKLIENTRKRIYSYIKNNSIKSIDLLGCSIEEYKQYLETQFTPEMNWDNYGTYWEIDHIKSLFTFDFKEQHSIKEAFNYKNTRPLSIKENRTRPKQHKI